MASQTTPPSYGTLHGPSLAPASEDEDKGGSSFDANPWFQFDPRIRGLTRILTFFALVVVLAYILDATITYGLRRIPTSKFGSLNLVTTGRVNADIIINGSSRALVHYDPRTIEQFTGRSAYNLGMNGVQIDVQLAVLKTYLKHNRTPQIVLQNLESFTFETTKHGELYDPPAYLPYLTDDTLYQSLLAIDPVVWKWKHIPLYGYTVEDMRFTWAWGLLGSIGVYGRENYFRGFNPRSVDWTGDFDEFKKTLSSSGVIYSIEAKGVKTLRELARVCKDAGIKLIFVYSPVYHEMQPLEKNRSEVFTQFKQIAYEFGIPFWDYSASTLCQQRSLFYNSQHLNATGAALFSTEVARRLTEDQLR
jgi:hypothetical protein